MDFNTSLTQTIEDSFTQYAGAVIQSRALVDVRDCVKPSARQIYWCLYTDKFTSDKPFKKTLKAVGSSMRVLAKASLCVADSLFLSVILWLK